MKTVRFLVAVAMLLAVFSLAVKPAAAQAFGTYSTGTQVMNVGATLATINITYYDGTGGVVGTVSDTIASFTSKTYFPVASGSAVISSDQPLAAVTNIQNGVSGGDTAGASYVGASSGSTAVGIPLLMKGNSGYNTWFTVQNAGSAAANVTVDYSDITGTSDATATINPGAASTFYQKNEAHTKTVFSAKITSTQPVVVVAVEEKAAPPQMFAYSGFPKGSKTPVMPLINSNNHGITTGVQIQNLGSVASNVTVAYTPSLAGTACTETQNIPAGESRTFTLFAFYNGTAGTGTTNCVNVVTTPPATFVGSANVTVNDGNVDLVAVVNQQSAIYGEAYGGFDSADATPIVVMPLIFDRWYNYNTGFSVQNIGSASTYIKCVFAGNQAVSLTPSGLIAPGAALLHQQYNTLGDKFLGSATCKAYSDAGYTTLDTGAKLVGIVNELGLTTADRLLVYEAINLVP